MAVKLCDVIKDNRVFGEVFQAADEITGYGLSGLLTDISNETEVCFIEGCGAKSGKTPNFQKLRERLHKAAMESGKPSEDFGGTVGALDDLLERLQGKRWQNGRDIRLQEMEERARGLTGILGKKVRELIDSLKGYPCVEMLGSYNHSTRTITVYRGSCKKKGTPEGLVFGHELFHAIHHYLRDKNNPHEGDFNGDLNKRTVVLEAFATAFEIKLALKIGKSAHAADKIRQLEETPLYFYPYSGALQLIDERGAFLSDSGTTRIRLMTEASFFDIDRAYEMIWGTTPLNDFRRMAGTGRKTPSSKKGSVKKGRGRRARNGITTTIRKGSGRLIKTPDIIFIPADEKFFHQELMRTKRATLRYYLDDKTCVTTTWDAEKITPTSNIRGNIRSKAFYKENAAHIVVIAAQIE